MIIPTQQQQQEQSQMMMMQQLRMEHGRHEDVIREFDEITRNTAAVQEAVLREILHKNSSCEYLSRDCNLGGRTDLNSFRSCVPLVTHADLQAYISRIADLDSSPSLLTSHPIPYISLSSGTTNGKQKLIPFNDDLLRMTLQVYRISGAFRSRLYPLKPSGRTLDFVYSSRESRTPGGLLACTATTHLFRSELFRNNAYLLPSCSPVEVIFGHNAKQSMYCHLLCGLMYSNEVQAISSTFSYSIVEAFRTFEQVWPELCDDIREGKLSKIITVPEMRAAVLAVLKPNPLLADSIHSKCSNAGDWYGIIPCIWPNARYISSILSGSMEPYLKKLKHYAGSLPLVSADYGATEGWIAANTDPEQSPENVKFTIVPNIAYFEFIPIRPADDELKLENTVSTLNYNESQPVGLTQVKVGHEYEVVITQAAGLYRYRLGDIVKVTGFYNSSPQIQFICRKQLILTVNIDKTTEKDLQISVNKATELLKEDNVELVDFTSYANRSKQPGHYVVFWELSDTASEEILKRCCSLLDASFIDPGYTGSRKAHTIGPLELSIVKKGSFKKVLDYYVALGGAVSQYKTPRCVTFNETLVDILKQNVMETYVSTYYS